MVEFKSGLTEVKWAALQSLHDSESPNWWKDLLSLWVLSGKPAGDDGLRLAIRDGYLNFYRRGQSVALVCFGAQKGGKVEARMEIHAKYVWCDVAEQAHAKLHDREVILAAKGAMEGRSAPYQGMKTLEGWIKRTAKWHGEEKRSVDAIVGNNPTVIDLEMAMPAWGDVKSALRLDLVALHRNGATPKLVFWEVKPLNSGQLRSENGDPVILTQVQNYRAYLGRQESEAAVRSAYMRVCSDLLRFAKMAKMELDPIIREASEALVVEREPGLALCQGLRGEDGCEDLVPYGVDSWEKHRAKLEKAKIRMIIKEDPRKLDLQSH